MAPWVQRIFIEFLPRILCIQRPKKEEEPQEEQPPEVLTDVFHVPPNVEKYSPFCTNKFSTDFDIPGETNIVKFLVRVWVNELGFKSNFEDRMTESDVGLKIRNILFLLSLNFSLTKSFVRFFSLIWRKEKKRMATLSKFSSRSSNHHQHYNKKENHLKALSKSHSISYARYPQPFLFFFFFLFISFCSLSLSFASINKKMEISRFNVCAREREREIKRVL